MLASNYFAQAEALMVGRRTSRCVPREPRMISFRTNASSATVQQRRFLVGGAIGPAELGALIVYYEHLTFTEALCGTSTASTWGVELGKVLAKKILKELDEAGSGEGHDASTGGLIGAFKTYAKI